MGPYKSHQQKHIQGKDDEARVFYVGATRAKERTVHLVHRTDRTI